MEINILHPASKDLMPVYQAIARSVLSSTSEIRLINNGFVCSFTEWDEFLRCVWSAYAECSRSNIGALISLPLRVRILDYRAETSLYYSRDFQGITYRSLVRYDS